MQSGIMSIVFTLSLGLRFFSNIIVHHHHHHHHHHHRRRRHRRHHHHPSDRLRAEMSRLIPLSITPAKKCLCQKSRNITAPLPLCYHLSYLLLASLTDFLFAGHVILGDNCVTRAKRTFA